MVNAKGEALKGEKEISLVNDGTWQKAEAVLTGTKTEKGRIKLTISGAKETDILNMDMVSLSSQDTYGYGNNNFLFRSYLR